MFAAVDGAVEVAAQFIEKSVQPVENIQGEHQQAITDRDGQIQAIQCNPVALQAQGEVYQAQLQRCQDQIYDLFINRHVSTSANDKYHNLPYYIFRIQRRKKYVKLRWLNRYFPDH